MLTIINNKNISCSIEDSFLLPISNENGFEDGSTLRFDIADGENSVPIISNTYTLSNGMFNVTLDSTERKKLSIGNYIYRILIISANGTVVTEKSGDFTVKWGA